ncbi:MAG: hypothetical protein L0Y78_05700 [candidate division NC10 bacterium]|nr:hypothetical protein [candidate division NC10 bacterium]
MAAGGMEWRRCCLPQLTLNRGFSFLADHPPHLRWADGCAVMEDHVSSEDARPEVREGLGRPAAAILPMDGA